MARVADLVSKDGASDGMSGVGANLWYAEVAQPAPTSVSDDLYVIIPDLHFFGGDHKFGPINWGGRMVPNLGDPLLVAFDNRQQMWALLDIADTASTPKITSGAMSAGPPTSPSDGDIWIATAVGSGVAWQFRYNAGSASIYKWEFIGGPPLVSQDTARTGRQVGSNSAWLAIPGIGNLVTVRAGDYVFHNTCWIQSSVGSGTYAGCGITGGNDPNIRYISQSATTVVSLASHGMFTSTSANATWKFFMFTSDFTTATILDPAFSLLPVRVS